MPKTPEDLYRRIVEINREACHHRGLRLGYGYNAILDLDHKLGFEPDFGSKVLNLVKIPLPHLVEICYGTPYLLNRSIKRMRYNNWWIRTFHANCIYYYKIRIFLVFLPFDGACAEHLDYARHNLCRGAQDKLSRKAQDDSSE